MELWGDIRGSTNAEWDKIVPKEIGKLVILSAIKPEIPKVKQPQPDDDNDQLITLGPEHSAMEGNVLYTIQLIKHARQVTELIRLAVSKEEEASKDTKDVPLLPKPPERMIKCQESFPRHYVSKEDSPFTRGDPIIITPLGREVTKEVLYKTVGTLCAHAGFDSAMQSSLQVLTDIGEEFLTKFTKLLKYAVDREELYGNSGFPDAMERVFHEMGLGSMVCLHNFYQQKVLLYRDRCEAASISLQEQYQALLPSLKREPDDLIRFKTELDSEEDIPEIHFPAMAEGDCVDELQSSLEPGFQMLHSLEQEVQMQSSMEQDEGDVNLIDSPQSGEASQPGSESWIATMKSKKRKRKLP